MMDPVQYIPKTLTEVTGMKFNAYDGTSINVKEWIESLMTTLDDSNYVIYGPLSDRLFIQIGDLSLELADSQYIYVDEDGFHVINQGTFETLYKEAPAS